MASPAAEVTACCSAMPTSKQRSGKALAKRCRPVGYIMAAVIATTSLVGAAQPEKLLGEDIGPGLPGARGERRAGDRVDLADRVEAILVVVLGRLEAVALPGQAVHEDRSTELAGLLERPLERADVVTVDRPDVLQTQIGEHPLRGEHVLQPDLDPVQDVVRDVAQQRRPAHPPLDHIQDLLVPRVGAQPGQLVGQAADGRGVGAAVVVDHDDQRQVLGRGDVVQRLPGHAAGQRSVADEGHRGARPALQADRLGQPVGVREGGGGVRVRHPVVLGLRRARVAGQAVALPQRGEPVLPAGEDLVHVALVAGVEDHRIARRLEHPVQRDGELDHAEVRSQMTTGLADLGDQEVPDLGTELSQLLRRQPTKVLGTGNGAQQAGWWS